MNILCTLDILVVAFSSKQLALLRGQRPRVACCCCLLNCGNPCYSLESTYSQAS